MTDPIAANFRSIAAPGQAKRINTAMRAAYDRVRARVPDDENFRRICESYVKGIIGIAGARGVSARRAALSMSKFADQKGQRAAADEVLAAFVWMEESLQPANDEAPTA